MKREHLAGLLTAALALSGCVVSDSTVADDDSNVAEGTAAVAATGHPRLWIRQADVPRLQSWAAPSNPMFAQGLKPAVDTAISAYNTKFFPNGQANPSWPDDGSDNYVGMPTEAYAELFAFMSVVDPDPSARAQHGARARNLFMHAINEAVKGVDTSSPPAPFRSRLFSTYNRANYWGEAWGLTYDWAYPYFSAADKASIQKVFLRWSNECVNASTTAGEHPQPVGVLNDPQLLSNQKHLRWTANNYYTGHMRALALMSLAFDAADDPLVNPAQPVNQLGNSMRSYLADVLGAWLYQQYATYEDPAIAGAALGVPATGLGMASGGLTVEGSLYGHALGYLQQAMLALYTAGYADPTLAGPQSGLITSGYWDRMMNGFLHSITPAAQTPTDPNYAYLGPVYQPAAYGDMLRFWMASEFISTVGSLGAMNQITGNTQRLQAERWYALNVLEGGAARVYSRAANVWSDPCPTCSINYFLLFDPSAPPAPDPRPNLPTTFTDKALGRVLSRTDWSPSATWFTYLAGWETLNHQNGACNQFELYRKGEWLTKELSGYANDEILMTGDYLNTLAIQNDVPQGLSWFETQTSARGGQWTNGMNAGDPRFASSEGAGWLYAGADSTNLYNRPGYDAAHSAMDVTHASRATVWLKPDHVIVYDRATTKTASRFKRWNLSLIGNPKISGKTADSITPGGQHLYVQNLLPAGATLTGSPIESVNRVADMEPVKYRLVIEDPSKPSDVRFLDVLQGADAGAAADPATLVQSTGGSTFQGVVVKNMAVLFASSPSAPFTGTTYVLPAGVTTHLVVGLTPQSGYTVTTQSTTGGVQVSISAGGSSMTDAAGVLAVSGGSAPPPPPPPPTCTPSISASSAQVAATASTGTVSVSVASGCTWSATSNASWITITSGSSGTGAGAVGYSVAANTSTSARSGTLTVAGQTFTVSQAASSSPPPPPPPTTCSYALSPGFATIPKGGATQTFKVQTQTGCTWTAASAAPWISLLPPTSGSGSATVQYQVPANTGKLRFGTITVGGKKFTVVQAGVN